MAAVPPEAAEALQRAQEEEKEEEKRRNAFRIAVERALNENNLNSSETNLLYETLGISGEDFSVATHGAGGPPWTVEEAIAAIDEFAILVDKGRSSSGSGSGAAADKLPTLTPHQRALAEALGMPYGQAQTAVAAGIPIEAYHQFMEQASINLRGKEYARRHGLTEQEGSAIIEQADDMGLSMSDVELAQTAMNAGLLPGGLDELAALYDSGLIAEDIRNSIRHGIAPQEYGLYKYGYGLSDQQLRMSQRLKLHPANYAYMQAAGLSDDDISSAVLAGKDPMAIAVRSLEEKPPSAEQIESDRAISSVLGGSPEQLGLSREEAELKAGNVLLSDRVGQGDRFHPFASNKGLDDAQRFLLDKALEHRFITAFGEQLGMDPEGVRSYFQARGEKAPKTPADEEALRAQFRTPPAPSAAPAMPTRSAPTTASPSAPTYSIGVPGVAATAQLPPPAAPPFEHELQRAYRSLRSIDELKRRKKEETPPPVGFRRTNPYF